MLQKELIYIVRPLFQEARGKREFLQHIYAQKLFFTQF